MVGLGNPGARYHGTRHNVGFAVLDRFVAVVSADWNWASAESVCAQLTFEGHDLVLMKPMTYMNLSGHAVRPWVERLGLSLSEVLVVFDDVALPLGRIRLRERGSAGGHNGLSSILEELGDDHVPRLRVGVGSDETVDDLAEFVLQDFDTNELETVDKILDVSVEASRSVLMEGMPKSMSIYNATVV